MSSHHETNTDHGIRQHQLHRKLRLSEMHLSMYGHYFTSNVQLLSKLVTLKSNLMIITHDNVGAERNYITRESVYLYFFMSIYIYLYLWLVKYNFFSCSFWEHQRVSPLMTCAYLTYHDPYSLPSPTVISPKLVLISPTLYLTVLWGSAGVYLHHR